MIGTRAQARLFALAISCSGCYGTVGPTIGVATTTGRPTIGVEGSGATVTVAYSHALSGGGEGRADERWKSRTYLLWEPGFGKALDSTGGAFKFVGGGLSLGARWQEPDQGDTTRVGFAGGAWLSGGSMLRGDTSTGCGDDVRPYAVLVVGIRGEEFYAAPKVGLVQMPAICINLGHL